MDTSVYLDNSKEATSLYAQLREAQAEMARLREALKRLNDAVCDFESEGNSISGDILTASMEAMTLLAESHSVTPTVTEREDLQPCGHPRAAISGECTLHCRWCEDVAEARAEGAAAERERCLVRCKNNIRKLRGINRGEGELLIPKDVMGAIYAAILVGEREPTDSEIEYGKTLEADAAAIHAEGAAAERGRLLDLELIADVQHEIWSKWMRHLFKVSQGWIDGSVSIPADKVNRWKYQMNTPYYELSENEKDSDRHQADLVIRAIRSAEEGE